MRGNVCLHRQTPHPNPLLRFTCSLVPEESERNFTLFNGQVCTSLEIVKLQHRRAPWRHFDLRSPPMLEFQQKSSILQLFHPFLPLVHQAR